MSTKFLGALAGGLALVAATSSPGLAQTQEQIEWCVNKEAVQSPDLQINGCTAVIQSGKWSGKDLAPAFNNRGNAYTRKGDTDRAIADYTQAIRLDPNDAAAFNNRCWARATANRDLKAALADCEQSLRLKPNYANALDSRAFVYLRLGEFDRSIGDYDAALALNPKQAASLYGRGVAKLRKGDAVAASFDFTAAKEIDPGVAARFAKFGIRGAD